MKISKELKYNLVIALLLILIGETWSLSFDLIFNNNRKWIDFNPSGFLFFTTFNFAYFTVYTLNYLVFAPKYLKAKKVFQYVLAFIAMFLAFAAVRFFLEEILALKLFNVHNYNLDRENIVAIYLFDSAGYAVRPCLYSSLVYLFFRYTENKTKVHQMQLKHQEAQVSMLRSQISPHFLFNTLNGFYSDLYDDKPETAKDILKLSQLLRYVTYEVKQNFMPLKNEVDFIKDYLYFYRKRYENDFYVNLSIDGHIDQQFIPSLVLIHFVENVCKHGLINDSEKPAEINLLINSDYLEITTYNAINSSEKLMDKGIGTSNIKKRLDVLFKNDYELNYNYDGVQFKAYLKMPL